MKIFVPLLIFFLSLGILVPINLPIANANSHVSPGEDPSLPVVQLQLVYRNSDGVLIHYMEPTIFYLRNLYLIHDFIDNHESKTIITKDGIQYEKVVHELIFENMEAGRQISQFALHHGGYPVLSAAHIGFVSVESGTFYVTWTLVQTIE